LHELEVLPGLATVMLGTDYGAVAYERRLRRVAEQLQVGYRHYFLAEDSSQEAVIRVVAQLDADPAVHGILILRPLPRQITESEVFQALDPAKDIECVHPENAGLLALGTPRFVPSTPAAVFHLLDTYLDTVGEDRAQFYRRSTMVVVGRSNNVGKPAVSLGYARQAVVLSCDEWASATGRLSEVTRQADVLIVAAGRAGLIRREHVAKGAIVLDVGINPRIDKGTQETHMVGDVEFEEVAPVVRALTPVPGGVGPVTDIWLIKNTALAASMSTGNTAVVRASASADRNAVLPGNEIESS
jgi:methylenetetrahydrofolate dehydrogenase (NADP+)/methenyltetrahydrofolate cyclohydrolase